ncbi:hypothetical protein [Kitasatospora sp. NPDC093806]|uniref:hypothetical protein n=1 Tax=Kitasatospora sp. NPDC093806 TaxID=3155075 RepID=UPI00343FA3DF
MTDTHRSALRYTADITAEDIDGLAGFIDRRIALVRTAAPAPGSEPERVGESLARTVAALTGSARELVDGLAGRAAEAADPDGERPEADEESMVRLSTLWRYLLTAAEEWSHLPDYDVVRWRLDGHLDAEHEARARWQEAGEPW